ncbi:HlyD family type I secretion periplasmic adaptor subunit [Vibrio mediterranei]|uniref:HlyD family type I secretion periplasmic adaptor subunit n=1 Tax=Vibrio mediterranei TaxID=689 RepID=UPI00148DADCE|nr:HlyD family type I secretion periplasmic adaptor subunit [Vibrio mediterranei]NOH28245.1 HlyD family type I secretion periplasmic adaptor subunit [Vibrio mediterranei]
MNIKHKDELLKHAPLWQQIRHSYPNRLVSLSVWVILGALFLLIIWASVSQVNTFVVARGHVKPMAQNIVIQSQAEGVLEQFVAQVGDQVTKGDLIAVIDGRAIDSDIHVTRYQMTRLKERIRRLEAELAETPYLIENPPRSAQKLEMTLFDARKGAYGATIAAKKETLLSLDERIQSLHQEQSVVIEQISLQTSLVKERRRLYEQEKDKYRRTGPKREAFLDSQKQLLELQRKKTSLLSGITSLTTEAKTTLSDLKRYISQHKVDVSDQLVSATREYIALKQQLVSAQSQQRLSKIHAPIDGIILKVADKTSGTYVATNEFLYEIVPINTRMEIVVDLNPADINQVTLGDEVTIKLDSLPFTKYGTMQGKLRQVSEDVLTDDVYGKEGLAYRGWIDITSVDGIRNKPEEFRLQPGLSLEANIQTDRRTLISYILFPIARALDESFREP